MHSLSFLALSSCLVMQYVAVLIVTKNLFDICYLIDSSNIFILNSVCFDHIYKPENN